MADYTKLLKIAQLAARKAGRVIMIGYNGREIKSKQKENKTWVTEVDLESERIILEILKKETPDFTILTEESGLINKAKNKSVWIVDPLDGTHNFERKIPLFAVSIALQYNRGVILGVIYLPFENIILSALKDKGTYMNGKKIKMPHRRLKDAIISCETYFSQRDIKMLEKFVGKVREMRIFNSACGMLAYVALSRIDVCLDRVDKPWDWAAGKLIISEAGGKVSNFKGEKLNLYKPSYIAASKACHKEVINILNA